MLRVRLFGPMQILASDGRDITPSTQKSRAILAMLLVANDGRRARTWLIDHLWSLKSKEQGQTSLRQSLAEIRKAFAGERQGVINADNFVVTIDLQRIAFTDADAAEATAEFLEGIDIGDPEFEEWLRLERSRPRRLSADIGVIDRSSRRQDDTVGFGLRVDPPIVSGIDREEEILADCVIDRIVAGLIEEGFDDILDRRPAAVLSFGRRAQGRNFPICLRCAVQRHAEDVRVSVALIDMSAERPLWMRIFHAAARAVRDEREPNLAAGLSECIERVWLEKERAARRLKLADNAADTIRAAVQVLISAEN